MGTPDIKAPKGFKVSSGEVIYSELAELGS